MTAPPSAGQRSAPRRGKPRAAAAGTPRLTVVTGNAGKLREMRQLLPGWDVVQDAGGYAEVQAASLQAVTAAGAAELLARGVPRPFILEDSGLFVDALAGFPGVYSRHAFDTIGAAGLLRLMEGVPPARRTAHFAADIALVDAAGRLRHFCGRCDGWIAPRAAGAGGFGFDPVFIPRPASLGSPTRQALSATPSAGPAIPSAGAARARARPPAATGPEGPGGAGSEGSPGPRPDRSGGASGAAAPPPGARTFAQLPPTGKAALSHRGMAARALARHLSETAKA